MQHNHNPEEAAKEVKRLALQLGFLHVGIAPAMPVDDPTRQQYLQWLHHGYHATMHYLQNHLDKRFDPQALVPGARSVICLAYNYYSTATPKDDQIPRVSIYAHGRDYHRVLKKKLKRLYEALYKRFPHFHGRYFVDSAPVLERYWAARAGLGWQGKNTLLIHPRYGSFVFLAVMITNIELAHDSPMSDHCGRCRRCIDACPTGALAPQGYLLDARRCISYLTIELKADRPIPPNRTTSPTFSHGAPYSSNPSNNGVISPKKTSTTISQVRPCAVPSIAASCATSILSSTCTSDVRSNSIAVSSKAPTTILYRKKNAFPVDACRRVSGSSTLLPCIPVDVPAL